MSLVIASYVRTLFVLSALSRFILKQELSNSNSVNNAR
jgi:hypothetical protein